MLTPRRLARTLVALAVFAVPFAPPPATASEIDPVNGSTLLEGCPEITDAIDRLYSAYFERTPDSPGFEYWANRWSRAGTDLPAMSEYFAASPEFDARYGSLSDPEFIELVYQNVLGRAPDADGFAYWANRLDRGLDRGLFMLLFSESPEYTALSGTTPSIAGFFNWLPPGAQFFCSRNGTLWGDLVEPRTGSFSGLLHLAPAPDRASTVAYLGASFDRIGTPPTGRPNSATGPRLEAALGSPFTGWVRFDAAERSVSRSVHVSAAPGTGLFLIVVP